MHPSFYFYCVATAIAVASTFVGPERGDTRPVGLLIAANFIIGAVLTFGMGYAESAKLDPVFDAACGVMVAFWWLRRRKVWKFVVVACLAAQCVVYATMRPWDQADAAPTAYVINLLFLILLAAAATPGGRHALERGRGLLSAGERASIGWSGVRFGRANLEGPASPERGVDVA